MAGVNTTRRLLPAGNAGSSSTAKVPIAGTLLTSLTMAIEPIANELTGRLADRPRRRR